MKAQTFTVMPGNGLYRNFYATHPYLPVTSTRSARSNSEFAAGLLRAAGASRSPRQPYAARWLGYPLEVRRRLAGSLERQEELDALAALPAGEQASFTASAAERMRLVVKRLEEAKAVVDELRTARNALMIEHAILGNQQSHIASAAGVTSMMVCHALATAAPRTKKATREDKLSAS